ncbi:hypothetical protein AX16_001258 [Volvariella volvacea WC 439]|nr:hypothetical protein AX16_001258 [Volvariella volvacea WC 439]
MENKSAYWGGALRYPFIFILTLIPRSRTMSALALDGSNCTTPKLPAELEREIFEQVAHESTGDLRTLRLVAQRVHDWLSPMFYEIVVCRCASDTLLLPKSDARYVHHLLYVYEVRYNTEAAMGYLSNCFNIQNLGIWFYPPKECLTILNSILTSPHRRPGTPFLRLSAKLSGLFGPSANPKDVLVNFRHPVFKDLTHLDVLDYHGPVCTWWAEGNNFGSLKELRYLSFNYGMRVSIWLIDNILRECKKLEVLVLVGITDPEMFRFIFGQWRMKRRLMEDKWTVDVDWYNGVPVSERAREAREQEDKIVFVDNKPAGWAEDWRASAKGEEDFWVKAKEVVKERRGKEKEYGGGQLV